MQRLTYKEAYDNVIEAYFKGEIEPYDAQFCFCGSLAPLDNNKDWDERLYTVDSYNKMEFALLSTIRNHTVGEYACDHFGGKNYNYDTRNEIKEHPHYEDALFKGMCAALDVLKEIHRSRGENVDEELVPFTKRNLKPVNA